MVIKKDLIITVLATFCLVSTMFIVLPRSAQNLVSTASALSQYDPWCDINHDGKINILDVVAVTSRYGTTGDPALNISVTNWPTSHDVCVWWSQHIPPSTNIVTNNVYNASGFGHLNVLVAAEDLTGQVTVIFAAPLYNQTRVADVPIAFYTLVLTTSNYQAAISVDVPSQQFYFVAETTASSSCYIYLSYYLTWS